MKIAEEYKIIPREEWVANSINTEEQNPNKTTRSRILKADATYELILIFFFTLGPPGIQVFETPFPSLPFLFRDQGPKKCKAIYLKSIALINEK